MTIFAVSFAAQKTISTSTLLNVPIEFAHAAGFLDLEGSYSHIRARALDECKKRFRLIEGWEHHSIDICEINRDNKE